MNVYDVIIVGGGPAGATAATVTAKAGLSTLVLERAQFPRDKVCGDCLNPGAWTVLHRLGISQTIDALPSTRLEYVRFANSAGRSLELPLPVGERAEKGIRRKFFDDALLRNATSNGAEIRFGEPVTRVQLNSGWTVSTVSTSVKARFLVAADGRNSTIARLLGDFPTKKSNDRVSFQTHFPSSASPHVALELCEYGYMGLATIGEGLMNLCLVCRPKHADQFRREARKRFELPSDHRWQSVTPLTRPSIRSDRQNLFYIGDAARVVEPFTGEGILYALRTGLLAGESIIRSLTGSIDAIAFFDSNIGGVYRDRLWINRLARLCVLHPKISSYLLDIFRCSPGPLRYLTEKVVGKRC
jgi:geranylgeranyl reductase family protein